MLFVICAPSGAGKTTIIKNLFKELQELEFSVSSTTREIRNNEEEGRDYYFIKKEEFEKKIKDGSFIEWEEVHGCYYGTLKSEITKERKGDVVFDVDVYGALSIKKLYPEAVTIFIDVPREQLVARLRNRKTETENQIIKRIERMDMELELKDKFDFIVDNRDRPDGTAKVVNEIINIINKERSK